MVTEYSWGAVPWKRRIQIKNFLIRRHGMVCHKCRQQQRFGELTIDHIYPIYLGGPVSDINNLQLLCRRCHALKTKHEQPSIY